MLHKVHPGSNTGMYFVMLYHSLARICRKTVVKLNRRTGGNAGASGASGQCSGSAVADKQNFCHSVRVPFRILSCRLYHKGPAICTFNFSRNLGRRPALLFYSLFLINIIPNNQCVNGAAANIFQKKVIGKFFMIVPIQIAGS